MSALALKSIALVGLGEAGRIYRELLAEFPELHLEAVIDEGKEGPSLGAECTFRSIRDMLARGRVPQLALICSPPRDHGTHAETLLSLGVDVLVTPPLAVTPLAADRIAALAEQAGRIACTAAPFRAFPALREARRTIESGRIGRLCSIECSLSEKRDGRTGSGVWMENGPHAIDVVEALAGPAERIRMLSRMNHQGGPVEDEVSVEVEHGDQLVSRICLTWNEERNAPIARCIGDRGEIAVGRAQSILRTEDGQETLLDGLYSEREGHREVLREFLATCRAPERTIDHGAQSVAWIHAAYRSLELGGWELC
jgi:predicted dehydrogenase